MPSDLDFIIIGAQKSGSTFLHHCLREHPAIFMPPHEVAYFEDFMFRSLSYRDNFLPLFRPARAGQLKGIKRPVYLTTSECPANIHRTAPAARLIAVLRHPVERAVSHYHHLMRVGGLPLIPVDPGLGRILKEVKADRRPKGYKVLHNSLYAPGLRRYLSRFDRSRLLLFCFDEIRRNPAGFVRRGYEFLGVSTAFTPKALASRPQRVIYSMPRLRWHRLAVPYLHKWGNRGAEVFYTRHSLFDKIFIGMIRLVDRRFLAPLYGNDRPLLGRETEERLLDYFRKDVEALERLSGWDLRNWKTPARAAPHRPPGP